MATEGRLGAMLAVPEAAAAAQLVGLRHDVAMGIRDGLRRERDAAQWLIGCLSAAIGIGVLIAGVMAPIHAMQLRDDGIRTSALIVDASSDDKDTDYELNFSLRDGTTFTTWTYNVQSGANIGDKIQVEYPPANPSAVEDVRKLDRWWLTFVLYAMGGILLILFGWSVWSRTPQSLRRGLLRRHGQ